MRLIQCGALDLDFALDLQVNEPPLSGLLERALAALPSARTTPAIGYRVSRNASGYLLAWGAEPVSRADAPPELLGSLIAHLNLAAIAASRGRLLLHAGAVALADGRVILLSGPSGSGKSTLTAELVSTGLAYLTDETLGVDPDTLAVAPYRKPLTVKPGSFAVLSHLAPDDSAAQGTLPWQVPVDRLGGRDLPTEPLRVALVVAPEFGAGHRDRLQPVSAAEAVFRLGSNSSSLSAVRPRPLEALARLVDRVPTYRLPYADVSAARDLVLSVLRDIG